MIKKMIFSTAIYLSLVITMQQNIFAQTKTNLINNSFLSDNERKLHLIYNGALYFNLNEQGDVWSRIKDGVKSIAFDPQNDGVYYIITVDNQIQKKTGAKGDYISIMSGLPRITFNNIVVNHHNANEVYIGSQKGIYRTMDGGFSWEHLGLDKDVITFLINPVERNKFIALTDEGLYSTVDDGNIWERADANLPKKVIKGTGRTAQELTIPIDLVSYINELNQEILVTSPDGIFVSDNDGKSWKNISEEFDAQIFNQKVTSFYYHDSIYYMGTLKAVYKSLNSGESWHKINILDSIYHIGSVIGISDIKKNGLMLNDNIGNIFYYRNDGKIISLNSGILTHSRIHGMGAKPIKNNKVRIFAVVENNFYVDKDLYGLFFTEDNGLTWRKSLIYKKPWDMRPSIFISPLNEEIWHFIGNDNALYYSENIGVEWSKIDKFNFHYSNDRIYDFVFDPIQSHIKYICAGVNDVFLFRYDQKTNNRMNLKVEAKKMLVARDDAKKLFTNTLKISTDGGWNWEDLSAHVKNVASGKEIIPIYFKENNILIYINNWDNYYKRGEHYLLLSNDLGSNWSVIKKIENLAVHLVYVNPDDNKNICLVLDNTKYGNKVNTIDVVLSYDGGITWKTIYQYNLSKDDDTRDNKNIIQCIQFVKNENGNSIFIGGSKGLLRSNDEGNSWEIMGGIK